MCVCMHMCVYMYIHMYAERASLHFHLHLSNLYVNQHHIIQAIVVHEYFK